MLGSLEASDRCVCSQIITRTASTRVAKYAFNYARENGRKKVTAVHKANIMKAADGLFLECCRDVSLEYPDILYNEMIVDNTCMQVRLLPLLLMPWMQVLILILYLFRAHCRATVPQNCTS